MRQYIDIHWNMWYWSQCELSVSHVFAGEVLCSLHAAASLTENFTFMTAHLFLLMPPKTPWERFFSVSINWQISRSQSAISSCFHDKPERKLDVYWLSQPETRQRMRPLEGRRRAQLSDNNLLFSSSSCAFSVTCRQGWKVWGFIKTAGMCPNPRIYLHRIIPQMAERAMMQK